MANLSSRSSHENATNEFEHLIADLNETLDCSSGLTIGDIDPTRIFQLLQDYGSKLGDWQKYAFSDPSRGYTRNLVDAGNGKSNLLVLVWTPGKGSPIHDHANAHCIMKVLQGRLQETLFAWPNKEAAEHGIAVPLTKTRERIYDKNQVTYMSDQLGLHRISNPDPDNIAVSLHLYTPPNAARDGCYMYDEKTGRRSHVQQNNFYSVYGSRT